MDFNRFNNTQNMFLRQPNKMPDMKQMYQLQQMMQMLQGKSPKEVFHELCKMNGWNPNEILDSFR